MNKLFTKIVGLALGLTMAVGVGVAVASNSGEAIPVHADSSITGYDPVSSLSDGDVVYFTYVAGGTPQVLTSVTSGTKGDVTAISNKTMNTTYPLTVGKSGSNYTFKDKNNKYIAFTSTSTSSNNKLWLVDSATANGATWTVSFSGTTATIVNVYNNKRTLRGNTTSGQYRICGYTNATGNLLTLYKEVSSDVTVTFNANGHGTAPSSQTITSGGKATQPTAPTATGWTFGGWYENSSCTGSAWNFNTTISANKTLWAKWTATTYSISYTLNGGTHGSTHPTSGTYDTAFSVSAPTKTGYTFTGWTVTSGLNTSTAKWGTTSSPSTAISSSSTLCVNGTNAVYFKNINAASTAVTLTANWSINSYTVGGTISDGHLSSTSNINYNAALDITIIPDQDYTYPSSIDSVTMGGAAYAGYTYDSTDGSFYIEHVTGNVVINAACVSTSATERFFDYHLTNCSIENAPESMYDTEMKVLQIVADDHYKFPTSITVTGISAEKWEYDADEGTILINEPDGDIDITVTCVAKAQNIISIGNLTGVTQKSGDPTTVEEGDIVTLTFIASSGYGLPTSSGVTVTGVDSQSWSWDQNSGELEILGGTSNITVSVAATQRDLTNASLTLGTKQTSYSLGDTFVKPSTITANFNLAPTSVDVKNDVVVTGPVNDDLVVTGSGTITITYTFPATGSIQSASYAITATPITPVTGGYNEVTASKTDWSGTYVIVSDEYMLGNSISSSRVVDADLPTISQGKITSTVTDAMKWTIAPVTGGYTIRNVGNSKYLSSTGANNKAALLDTASANSTWTIAYNSGFTITNKANADAGANSILRNNGTYGWACYAGGTGAAPQMYEYTAPVVAEIKWITAEVKPGTYYQGNSVTASDFTVTAHYNNGDTSTLSSGVTVTNGYLANIGNNEVTLTYSGKSCKVNVTAVEQTAEYTGLSWTQGEYTIIDGQNIDFSKFGTVTAEYDDGEAHATKAISSCTVATYTKSGDIYTKVADLSDGAKITSSSHGKYLGVTYTETNTYTTYSSAPIYVVEAINDVYEQVATYSWSKVTSLNAGDIVTFVSEEHTKVASEMGNNIISAASYEGSVSTEFYFTVGTVTVENQTYYTFQNENGYLGNHSTGTSSNNYAYLDAEIDTETNKNYFTVSFDEGNVVITSVYDGDRVLQMRSGNTNDRFCFYGSSQDVIQLYKATAGYTPSGESFANTNATVQKAVLQFAEHFNGTMNCVNSGSTANVASKWSTLSSDFSTAMSGFTGDDLAHFKALFAYAYSVEGGDTLQDMLSRYDYIVHKYNGLGYNLADFLNNDAGRGAVNALPNISPLSIITNNSNAVAIVVIVSMISLTAVGGYFFLRRRKEI